MNTFRCILYLISLLSACSLYGQSDFYVKRWSQVYRHEIKGLPKSAMQVVDTIYARAKLEHNTEQFVKSLLYQSKFTLTLAAEAEISIIQNFEKEIRESSVPQRNILESILGTIYWDYFKRNRWRYYQRSHTAERVDSTDFRTWDAKTIISEIHALFDASLKEASALEGIGLHAIRDLLTHAENSRTYRPTVFDLLAHNALEFYHTPERSITQTREAFILKDTLYFRHFEDMTLTPPDEFSTLFKALELYHTLLAFHKRRGNITAYVNLEIERLQFLGREGSFANAPALHKKALRHLRDQYRSHEASALIDFELASILFEEGKEFHPKSKTATQYHKRDALTLCDQAIKNFPGSDGARKCEILKEEILSSEIDLTAEAHVPIDAPSRILVAYTNTSDLIFSVYQVDASFERTFQASHDDSLRWASLSSMTARKQWHVKLKDLDDHQQHTTEVIVPGLSQGRYLLLAQATESIPQNTRSVYGYTFIQVTNLAMLECVTSEATRYQIIDRNTGQPMGGAQINFTIRDDGGTSGNFEENHVSDDEGFFTVSQQQKFISNLSASVTHGQDTAVFGDYYFYEWNPRKSKAVQFGSAKTFMFTDRSIYRPGQTLYFKGILIKTKEKRSSVVAGEYVEVFLEDTNGKEIGTQRLKTTTYGSFSGEFKLPSSGITGEYTLYADEDAEGESKFYEELDNFDYDEVTISVEEYKRSTFEVVIDPVRDSFSVRDSVSVKGKARAFNGSAISNAPFRYHIKRVVRYSPWHYMRRPPTYSADQEIATGEGVTNGEGQFNFTFVALPDESISREDNPVFHYEVQVDVTDINGETRSANTDVKVGYHSLVASLHLPATIDNKTAGINKMTVSTENLNNEFLPAAGIIRIYKLASPESPLRPRPWPSPDLPLVSEDEFKTQFPHDAYEDESDPLTWGKERQVVDVPFNTETSKEVTFKTDRTWVAGTYQAELHATDPEGMPVTSIQRFTVFDSGSKTVYDNQLLVFETDKSAYKPGETAILRIGSASPDITLTVNIERGQKIVQTHIVRLSNSVKEITVPVTAAMGDGFALHCTGANYNAFFYEKKTIPVISDRDQIHIETTTFKDKILPGDKETWSFEIKGDGSQKVSAEVLASMYDASLDQFQSHAWRFNPMPQSGYSAYHRISANESFGNQPFVIENQPYRYFIIPEQHFDQLDWFGFSIHQDYYANRNYIERLYSTGIEAGKPSRVSQSNRLKTRKGIVSGSVRTHDGRPLAGVNIVVRETQRGTTTDNQGNYSLAIDKGYVLVFTHVGYSTARARVTRKNTIDVTMEEDITALAEVVVTATGIEMKRKALAHATIAVEEMVEEDTIATEGAFEFQLQGQVSGVRITGMQEGTAQLAIRGQSTIDGGRPPLYVVDGVIVESLEIPHQDLADVQVLKGDAATTLYGARAVNGVIIVSTRSGQKKLDDQLAKIQTRKNFNETAFFFPHLTTDLNGRIRFTFTTPESLTRWKLQLLAHTQDLNTASKTLEAVSQKEFMVAANAPRFVRMGDEIVFVAKLMNLTGRKRDGSVVLQLSDAITGGSIDQQLGNITHQQAFSIDARSNADVSWKLRIPEGVDAIQYKLVAKAGNFSDGEQNIIPVLPNRMLVTETLPIYASSSEPRTFSLDKLKRNTSRTLEHHRLTLEVTSNPAWYAVQALPYLMEYPYDCSEQIFARYYAFALAHHIMTSDPRIKSVFNEWNKSGALTSGLEKNSELKSIILEETPWLRDARSESEQKKHLAQLFNADFVNDQMQGAVNKLDNMQLADGGFPWFAGGNYANRFITQHIVSGWGHLKKLSVIPQENTMHNIIGKAIGFLDREMERDYNSILRQAADVSASAGTPEARDQHANKYLKDRRIQNHHIHYLYMRSFFQDIPLPEDLIPAAAYFEDQSAQYWKDFNIYLKGMIALVQYRNGNHELAKDILESLRESSIVSEELGMYWKENTSGLYWHESAVEAQALMIEAFSEIAGADSAMTDVAQTETVDKLKIWLLKNKQTNQWRTTKATTEAVYALLLRGADWKSIDKQTVVSIGKKNIPIDRKDAEAGTGYFKTSWTGKSLSPEMGEVSISTSGEGISWGGLYWQYFEDLDKITSAKTPLQLDKKVFVVTRTGAGELLTEVNATVPLEVGDLIRVRIELTSDRQMEFLHMKDLRASGFEPVDVLSGYKRQDGLGYYQSTRDVSTNFFFDRMDPGVYVFEYDLRVTNKGNFSNGITTIQSMYAPEFSSHSEGIRVSVD